MKRKYILIPLLSGAVAFTACKEKSSTASPATPSDATTQAEPSADSDQGVVKPSASVEDRAAKLGFAKNLPKDIAYFGAIYDGRKAFDQFIKSGLGVFVMQRMADEGLSLDDVMSNEEFATQIATYSEEYFTAYGEGTGEVFDLVMNFYERLAYYGARTGVTFGDGFVRDGEDYDPDIEAMFKDGHLKGIPKEVIGMLASFEMPSFYQGAKVSDQDAREALLAQMEQSFSILEMMFDEAVEPITIKRGDTEFTGYKVDGKKLSEKIDEDVVEEMQEVLDIADIESFKEELAKKSFIAVNGEMGDYVITFFGKSEDDLVFVDKAEDSICANEHISFIDSYLEKDILTASYSDSEVMKDVGSLGSIGYRMVGSLAKGLGDGLAEASSLGDTQDVEVLLDSLVDQGGKLASLFDVSNAGSVSFLEDGLKVEVHGGSNTPSLDLTSTHSLSPLAEGEGTLLFANWTQNKEYNQKVMEYIDTLGETSYMVTKRVAALDIDDRDFDQFKQGVDMFDQTFRSDVLEIWKALRGDLSGGLGAESALVIDVNGSLPKIPNVPQKVLDEGKTPRISYVSTVEDRSKLQASWKRINTSTESILKTVSKIAGQEIPMQVPMSSEKNDLKTWFVPIPFQNDDFVPSVSVSDELFFVSTSKTFSEGLAEQFKKGEGVSRKGAWLHVDFKVLNNYTSQWLELVAKNADEIIPSESARKDFETNKPMIDQALNAFGSLDEMTMHTRNEGGQGRISFHLKAK